jgi:hypothetical protein
MYTLLTPFRLTQDDISAYWKHIRIITNTISNLGLQFASNCDFGWKAWREETTLQAQVYLFMNLFNYLFYLTTLSVAQTIYRPMIGWLMNNALERIWKESAVS